MFKALLEEHDLGKTLEALKKTLGNSAQGAGLGDRLAEIEDVYGRMKDFMLRGYHDPASADVYSGLLRKTYRLAADMQLERIVREKPSLAEARTRGSDPILQQETPQTVLETYVQNVAMLSLEEDEPERERKAADLYQRHQQYVDALFSRLLVSRQWGPSDRERFEHMALTPTVDGNDACLMVSAVTLALTISFDYEKWLALVNISRKAGHEPVRQRALTGWALNVPTAEIGSVFNEAATIVEAVTRDKDLRRQLLELQIQVFYCNHADKDNEEMQRDIIPTLLQNERLRFTPQGIVEHEEDEMEDILSPGAAEERMEKLEASIDHMMDMQRRGADIYFGGFSQMKRFPFFYRLSNWFSPFVTTHPAIATIAGKLKDTKFLQILAEHGPFCDSDKYSFVLAFTSIVDKLPADIRQLLNNADILGPNANSSHTREPAYIRRMYLQDLYRFFRLYPQKPDFPNPFAQATQGQGGFFFPRLIGYSSQMGEETLELERHLYKHHITEPLERLLAVNASESHPAHLILAGRTSLRRHNYAGALAYFQQAAARQPDSVDALRGMAETSFYQKDYNKAENTYQRLCTLRPDNRYYLLCLSTARLYNDHTAQAMTDLYRLDYEQPDSAPVRRALAWGYMLQGKFDRAGDIYQWLLTLPDKGENSQKRRITADSLYAGICLWARGEVRAAVGMFRQYHQLTGSDLRSELNKELKFLDSFIPNEAEYHIMLNLIFSRENGKEAEE